MRAGDAPGQRGVASHQATDTSASATLRQCYFSAEPALSKWRYASDRRKMIVCRT